MLLLLRTTKTKNVCKMPDYLIQEVDHDWNKANRVQRKQHSSDHHDKGGCQYSLKALVSLQCTCTHIRNVNDGNDI